MFTIKLYANDGFRQRIMEAESFTVLRGGDDGGAEITLHRKNSEDSVRVDIGPAYAPRDPNANAPQLYQRAIIENSAGKTTEIVGVIAPALQPVKIVSGCTEFLAQTAA